MNQKWQTFLKKIGPQPLRDQINKVNTYFNSVRYIVDPVMRTPEQ